MLKMLKNICFIIENIQAIRDSPKLGYAPELNCKYLKNLAISYKNCVLSPKKKKK